MRMEAVLKGFYPDPGAAARRLYFTVKCAPTVAFPSEATCESPGPGSRGVVNVR